jgi:hypothetical protein
VILRVARSSGRGTAKIVGSASNLLEITHRFVFILVLFLAVVVGATAQIEPRAPSAAPSSGAVAAPNVNDHDNAHKARALIDQTIQALGGQAYLNAQNRAEQGRVYSLHHGESRGLGNAVSAVQPFSRPGAN